MFLDTLFKIAFFIVFFSFAFVMAAYTKKAKTGKEDKAARVKMHNESEVPLLLKPRTIFGIPFYLGVLVWTFAPKLMEWASIPFPVWLRWAGLGLGIFAIILNAWSHRALSQKLGADFDPAMRLLKAPMRKCATRSIWHSF